MSAIITVQVREAPRTSLLESQIARITLPDGAKIMSIANTFPPHHNRFLHQPRLAWAREAKPKLIIVGGGILSSAAIDSLRPSHTADGTEIPRESYNFLHTRPEPAEIEVARTFRLFEDRVEYLGAKVVGAYLRELAEVAGCPMIIIPSASEGTRGWWNDLKCFEVGIHAFKHALDIQSRRQKESLKRFSDPDRRITKDLAEFLGLPRPADASVLNPGEFLVLRPNGGVLVNDDTLFMIGKRPLRQPGDASMRDWAQFSGVRHKSIVRFHDGKVAENYLTVVEGSVPDYNQRSISLIECGHGYDPILRGDLDDYDFRAPGFVISEVLFGELASETIPQIRDANGIYRFVYDGKSYAAQSADLRGYGEPITIK